MSKKQEKRLEQAKSLINAGISEDNIREWDNFFEDGEKNNNAMLVGLCRAASNDELLRLSIIKNKHYMPALLLKIALFEDSKILEWDKEIKLIEQGDKYIVAIEFGGEAKDHNKKNAQFAYNFLCPLMKKNKH